MCDLVGIGGYAVTDIVGCGREGGVWEKARGGGQEEESDEGEEEGKADSHGCFERCGVVVWKDMVV